MSKTLSSLYPTKAGMIGFNWTTDNEVTTDQTPTTSNFGQRYLFTQSTTADRTITLPSVGTDEDNKWLVVSNFSKYTITIEASDSDTIGWPALNITAIEILPNTQVIVRYDHSNTKWEIAFKVGGQCRPSGTVLYCPFTELTGDADLRPVTPNLTGRTNVRAIKTSTGQELLSLNGGKVNQNALDINGTTQYGVAADSPDGDWDLFGSTTGDVTLCGWVYCDGAASSAEMFFTHYEDANNRWIFYRNSSGNLTVFFSRGGDIDINISGNTLNSGTWYHVALVKVGAETGIYIDGTQVAYDATFTPDTFAGSLYIGQKGDGSQYFDGKMDDWAIVYHNIFGASPNSTPDDSFTIDTLNPLGLVL